MAQKEEQIVKTWKKKNGKKHEKNLKQKRVKEKGKARKEK